MHCQLSLKPVSDQSPSPPGQSRLGPLMLMMMKQRETTAICMANGMATTLKKQIKNKRCVITDLRSKSFLRNKRRQ